MNLNFIIDDVMSLYKPYPPNKKINKTNLFEELHYLSTEDYNINNYGYRGPDFIKNIDILAVGCSQTFGVGIPEDGTWIHLLAQKNNLTYNNLSIPGASVMQLVQEVFKYIDIFNKPKYLIALFPDLTRLKYFADFQYIGDHTSENKMPRIAFFNKDFSQKNINKKYIKMPVQPNDIFSDEYLFHINLIFLNILEKYCKLNNIKLIWSTWYNEINTIKCYNKFNNFYKMNFIKGAWETDLMLKNCHSKYKNNFIKSFNWGTDGDDISNSHMGVHCHLHIFERFDKILKDFK